MTKVQTPDPHRPLTGDTENPGGGEALDAAGPRHVDIERTELDDQADRLHAAGRLRLFETVDGAVMLGYVEPEVDHLDRHEAVVLGEIESRTPDGMDRNLAPEHVGPPFRDAFFLTGSPPADGWDWVAWAYSVPATVEGIDVPHALRVTIASAASAASTLVDLSGLLRQFTDRINRSCESMANANAPEGGEPGELLSRIGDVLRTPLMQRIDKAARNLHPDAGFLVNPTDEPLQLDGSPRHLAGPVAARRVCEHGEVWPEGCAYRCHDCDEMLVEVQCRTCDMGLFPHQVAAHLTLRCWAEDSPLVDGSLEDISGMHPGVLPLVLARRHEVERAGSERVGGDS